MSKGLHFFSGQVNQCNTAQILISPMSYYKLLNSQNTVATIYYNNLDHKL